MCTIYFSILITSFRYHKCWLSIIINTSRAHTHHNIYISILIICFQYHKCWLSIIINISLTLICFVALAFLFFIYNHKSWILKLAMKWCVSLYQRIQQWRKPFFKMVQTYNFIWQTTIYTYHTRLTHFTFITYLSFNYRVMSLLNYS